MEKIILIGAGDGGRTVSQQIKVQQDFEILGFIDDDESKKDVLINGFQVLDTTDSLQNYAGTLFVVTIAKNLKMREFLFQKALNAGLKPCTVIHNSAVIDPSAHLGSGIIILANCIVNPFAIIGDNVFLFTSTIIEHDDIIGENVYFAPGVCLGGNVVVGKNTSWGINSCSVEGVNIGSNVIIGAGSVVLKDIPDNLVVAGVPAKEIRKNE